MAILRISFLAQVRRHFREIEGEAGPSLSNRHGVKDIRQWICGVCGRAPTSDASECESVSKLEITVSVRELGSCSNHAHIGGAAIVIEKCAIAHDIQRRAKS